MSDGNATVTLSTGWFGSLRANVTKTPIPGTATYQWTAQVPYPLGIGKYPLTVVATDGLETAGPPLPAGATSYYVQVTIPGDANLDDLVNVADYNPWAANVGDTGRLAAEQL